MRQMEKAADENQRIVFQMRMDHKKRSRYLQQTLSDLRIQLSGAVKLEKYEVRFSVCLGDTNLSF